MKTSDRVVTRRLGSSFTRTFYSKTTRTTLPQNLTIKTLDRNKHSYKLKNLYESFSYIDENIKYGNFEKYFENCLTDFDKKMSADFLLLYIETIKN